MRPLRPKFVFATLSAIVGLGLFHIASPVAVSAQNSAVARVEVTVLPADAAWAAHDMVRLLARGGVPEAATGRPRGEAPAPRAFRGISVWLEDAPAEGATRVVTVAHLAH